MFSPGVSVCMLAYNQERYIQDAIESVLKQKTTFPFLLVIGEDGSTDKTNEICRKYASMFPQKIKYSRGAANKGMQRNFFNTLQLCDKEYVAFCEGDDYWIDPDKLQKQYEFLKKNDDCSICFHNVQQVNSKNEPLQLHNQGKHMQKFTLQELAVGNFIATVSCMYRNRVAAFPEWAISLPASDYPLHLLNAQFGKVGYLPDVMAAYRIHEESNWSSLTALTRLDKEVNKLIKPLMSFFGPELAIAFRLQINNKTEAYLKEIPTNNVRKAIQELGSILETEDILGFVEYQNSINSTNERINTEIKNSSSYRWGNKVIRALKILYR